MSLETYKKKRKFDETPEPRAKKKSSARKLRFVVQKHDASRLHYDFRLEEDGVLKSWAVPKGPSMNPADKRLAVHVEDHPYDYRNFEGTIPEGNYGAGTVMVWDEGTYEKTGPHKYRLDGQKLKGEFSLVPLPDGKNWLLIKRTDEFASTADITKKAKSVKTGRTLKQIADAA